MRAALQRALDSPRSVAVSCAISVLLGYFFIFVWAPHPWSWQGIDAYHQLARDLAAGKPFGTTDVPWGYAYYIAFFYRMFGEVFWLPLVVQATLNGLVPLMLFHLVRPLAGRRVATLSAMIAGVFSFNTVFASTQSSDAVCTVLFLAALLALAKGVRENRFAMFALSGLIFGLVPQFRPNMVLFPLIVIAVCLWLKRPWRRQTLVQLAAFALLVVAVQAPWIVRNYRLTGLALPTSTHGGVQLWYGTLQVGPYLESRAHNPRTYFESAAFDYTSLSTRPILITADYHDCRQQPPVPTVLVYWTDRDRAPRRIPSEGKAKEGARIAFSVPPQPNWTALYYYFEQRGSASTFTAPFEAAANPYVAFISDNHLGDLDAHGDILDIFDLARMLQHVGWQTPLPFADRLDLNHDGTVDARDIDLAVRLLVPDVAAHTPAPLTRVNRSDRAVRLELGDGSWIDVPRAFNKQTDLDLSLHGDLAPALVSRHRTFSSIAYPPRRAEAGECVPADEQRLNAPFNWSEPHMMNRYMALAFDNIGRDPVGFAAASLYRFGRLFIVRGTDDTSTTQQFNRSTIVYGIATLLSAAYMAVFLYGVLVAWRQRSALLIFLVPIVYVPVTICFVLTNMRYTVTVQPLMFAFVAAAVVAALRLDDGARQAD